MRCYRWNSYKNQELIKSRGISFEEVEEELRAGQALDDYAHPNSQRYPNQRILAIKIRDYVYLVPYVIESGGLFLKTIVPSRKATKRYLGGGDERN
jgi:uncharacterized DUF497 family protein